MYLLVEEIEGAGQLARLWTYLYGEDVFAETRVEKEETGKRLAKLYADLAPILREHIKPDIPPSGSIVFEPEGPGIRAVL